MRLTLDRMAVDEVGGNPARLAREILNQIGPGVGSVPIEAIAAAADIVEIRYEPLVSFEGALITTPERGFGSILVNANSNFSRRRFTAAHELGHFLNPWHLPTAASGFWCNRKDFTAKDRPGRDLDRHFRQEAEANAFAIELLAPRERIRCYLAGVPNLEKVIRMSDDMQISKEAAVRRYVELHDQPLAVVFSQNGLCVYCDRSNGFPDLAFRKGSPLPGLPSAPATRGLGDVEDGHPHDWLKTSGGQVALQTLYQKQGWAMTLLHVQSSEEDDADVEDAYQRFSRFSADRT